MGVDTRWICHTCKTIYTADGARARLSAEVVAGAPSQQQMEAMVAELELLDMLSRKYVAPYSTGEFYVVVVYLQLFRAWLTRHMGHRVWITNDYAADFACLEDYIYEREK